MGAASAWLAVGTMLLYALPGFFLIKLRAARSQHIAVLSVLLLYVCQPCLTLYSFQKLTFSWSLLKELGLVFFLALLLQGVMLGVGYGLFRRKLCDVRKRVALLSTVFGNCAFMGTPLVETLLPQYPQAPLYATMFYLAMSLLGWTLGCTVLTGDSRHVRLRTLLLNPALLALCVALPLFCFSWQLPAAVLDPITLLGKMTTPLCMLSLGMRLAQCKPRTLFGNGLLYGAAAIKLVGMPLLTLLMGMVLGLEHSIRWTLYLLCCCPAAAIIQNFAELLGEGQDTAAQSVVLSTLLSLVSIPLMLYLC